MSHLDFDRIFDIVGGSATEEDSAHLLNCEICRGRIGLWRTRLDDLREVESNRLEASEIHRLRVLFRELRPSPEVRSWVARLVRSSAPASAEAIRGSLAATLEAYEAGPYQIVLQTSPSDRKGRYDLQGQLIGSSDHLPACVQVVLTSECGFVHRAEVDAFGEFRIVGVPPGICHLACFGAGVRLELDNLTVGESDDNDGN